MPTVLVSVPGLPHKKELTITPVGNRFEFEFPYCKPLLEEIKAMEGSKWHGYDEENPRKIWSISDTPRNRFALNAMLGVPVFARYDAPLIEVVSEREGTYPHQLEFAAHGLTRHRGIWAGEMGTGKTLAAIMVMEMSGRSDWWWVGTKASLKAVAYEFKKWNCKVTPRFISYDSLHKIAAEWTPGEKMPIGVFFDESSRLKTWHTKRTEAGYWLSTQIEKDHGDDGYVILMSGSPAPKDPTDWWPQCEIAKPGFIRESTVGKFKMRLCITEKKQGTHGVYNEVLSWRDDERKCTHCGEFQEHEIHASYDKFDSVTVPHQYTASVNEVAKLYQRMKGLVVVKFKKDVLKFLPEKQYEVIECPPDKSTLRAASTIFNTAPNAMTALTLLRELSDGFQYTETPCGFEECPRCLGRGVTQEYFDPADPDRPVYDVQPGHSFSSRDVQCTCNEGKVVKYTRSTIQVPCPKDDALRELLDRYEDTQRFVTYAGFGASVDRCCELSQKEGWATIRVDGRGWLFQDACGQPIAETDMLSAFQDQKQRYAKINFVGHPGSAGMGLTLTASSGIGYFSNDFNGESRIQSEDRINRPGMDIQRGSTIHDICHLPSDMKILNNVRKKIDMMRLTMGDFTKLMEGAFERVT